MPCWAAEGLSHDEMQERVGEIVDQIAHKAAIEHEANGTRPSSPAVFLRVHPHQRPERTKGTPLPLVHAATREVRQIFREAYALFIDAYRAAAELLRAGHGDVVFPDGSFPPRLPFVPLLEPG